MNKFVASALLALVAVAAATSVPALYNPTDEREVSPLQGDATEFSEYCLKQRDYILADIKANETIATKYSTVLEHLQTSGTESMDEWTKTLLFLIQGTEETTVESVNVFKGVCADFSKYDEHFEGEFQKFVSEHHTKLTDSSQVQCLTTTNVKNLVAFCGFAQGF